MEIGTFLLLMTCTQQAASMLHIDAPALAVDEELRYRAIYVASTVVVRPDADCGVIFHELVHHRQFRDAGGMPLTADEWRAREYNALRLELMYRGSR